MISVLTFLLGVLVGLIIMAVLAASSREHEREEACRMSKLLRDYESKTIDVTEVCRFVSQNDER